MSHTLADLEDYLFSIALGEIAIGRDNADGYVKIKTELRRHGLTDEQITALCEKQRAAAESMLHEHYNPPSKIIPFRRSTNE